MTKPRKNAPALYELIRERSRAPSTTPPEEDQLDEHEPEPEEEPSCDEEPPSTILGPGRTVRMPVGYFFFGLAIVIATGIGGYILGFRQSEARYERQRERQARLDAPADPLDRPINRRLLAGSSPAPEGRADSDAGPSGSIGAFPSDGGTGTMVIVEQGTPDPRQRGVNYAVVASLGRERALDLGRFLTERGVDVAVVKLNNARLPSVIALRGFPSGHFRTEQRRSFEATLRRLGQEHADRGGGRKDFAELWWDRYDG